MSCTSSRRLHPASQSSSQHWPSRTISCGLSKGTPMPHCKYAPQSVLGNSNCKLHYDRSVITYPTIHNYRPGTAVLDKPSKKCTHTHTHTLYTAMPNNHNLHSTITQKLLTYTDLKEELFRIWRLKTTYVLPTISTTHNRYYPKQPTRKFETAQSSSCSIYSNTESSST
jgi:hypothetical protein